jgi:uncharacterized surface protein with fasciclin (FAS1) repeats
MRVLTAVLILALAPTVAGAAPGEENCSSRILDLKRTAEQTGVLKEMAAATKLAGLGESGVDIGPLTIFAPTDEAFNALPEGFRRRLLAPENRAHLTALLMHHAVLGEYTFERLRKARAPEFTVPAVDASGVQVSIRRGLSIEGAHLIEADIRATNGIIHLIDRVLVPPEVKAALWDPADDAPAAKIAGISQ